MAPPPVTLRRSKDPGRPLAPRRYQRFRCCPQNPHTEDVIIRNSRGSMRRFVTRCLRFTTQVAVRHAKLASGWPAAPLPGRSRTRWGAVKGFRSSHPPLHDLTWRKGKIPSALTRGRAARGLRRHATAGRAYPNRDGANRPCSLRDTTYVLPRNGFTCARSIIPPESPVREMDTRGSERADWKCGQGSRSQARSESDGKTTGLQSWRASPLLYKI